MEYRDYYATLGVPRTATQPDIKKAFRKLARKHHPDVNASDGKAEARFKEVSEAYDVLGDPEKRALYDRLGADWEAIARAGGTPGGPGARPGTSRGGPFPGGTGGVRFQYHGDPEDLAGFSEFFRTFFAGGMDETPPTSARGTRAAPGGPAAARHGRRTGAGARMTVEDLFSGTMAGDGRQVPPPGAEADLEVSLEDIAAGTTALVQVGDRRLEVTVPQGIESGQRIRLSGKAPGGGDLTLAVRVRPHAVFTRSGSDVTRELPISLGEALLGASIPVGTLAGRTLLLTIPPGTQNGRSFRLRGHGLPRFRGEGSGDLLVRTRVVLPGRLDDEGIDLARALVDHIAQPDPRGEAREPVARG